MGLVRGGRRQTSPPICATRPLRLRPEGAAAEDPAFWEIVDAGRAPEDAEMADVLEAIGDPNVHDRNTVRASRRS